MSKKDKFKYKYVGNSIPRIDARSKVTGRTDFIKDMQFPNLLHAKMVLSPHPHAHIQNLDVSKVKRSSGVVCVLTGSDVPHENQVGLIIKDQPLFADKKVRYAGDAVAIIAAETEEEAKSAESKIQIDLKPIRTLYSAEKSFNSKRTLIHPGGNVLSHLKIRRGNHANPLKSAAVTVEASLKTPHQEHAYLETLGTVVVPHKDGSVTVYGSIQCPYYVQRSVSEVLGIKFNKVKIVQAATGGAFGGKEDVPSEICSRVALVAVVTGRPVRLIMSRAEDAIYSSKRHPFEMRYKIGAKKNGKLVGVIAEQYAAAGAYATLSPVVMFRAVIHAAGPYVIQNVKVDTYACYTNHPPSGAFRGFGAPQSAFGIERTMDLLADELGMDPIELRERNILRAGDRTVTNQLLSQSVGLPETLKLVKESSLIKNKKRKKQTGRYVEGVGTACMHYGNTLGAMGWYLDAAGAHVQVHRDGSISVAVGITELGQGSGTTLVQMAADAFGVKTERIRVLEVDTSYVPDSGPTVASRSTIMSGNAILNAAEQLRPSLSKAAGRLLKIAPSKVIFKNDRAYNASGKGKSLTFEAVAENAFINNEKLAAAGWWVAPYSQWDIKTGMGSTYFAYSFATHAVKVRVDTLTGKTKVLEVVAAHDVGKAINPEGVRAQSEGGIVQGIGYALYEDLQFKDGKLMNPYFSTYILPYPEETPKITTLIVEEIGPDGPYGAKSMGEPPIIPIGAAVVSAVSNALGVQFREMPLTPERILRGIGVLKNG
ncbi:xanthine dehydrogenase [Candidatus Marinimicrobia bacterium MT.SAG.3]|nr:xanthine dehydrogenase [Candidatus Marinimicrobia bacterium MT.SAG.3]